MGIDNLSGLVLGQYQLHDLIGKGGMAAVYRGHQISLRRDVAIKILPLDLAQQNDYAQRFWREAAVAGRLEHPHIVPVYDYGTAQGITYVVMRLLTGGTLADRMDLRARQHLPLPSLGEIARILSQLASALDHAHQHGIIHRDIKPSNIMFDEHGTAYIVDFGIAKLVEATNPLTSTGLTMGTPLYMSPEQWRGEHALTQAADQYALAVMIYALLTGQTPFNAPTPYALMHKHLTEPPPPPHLLRPDLPVTVTEILDRALAKNAPDRFPTVGEFARAFEQVAFEQPGYTTNLFVLPLPPKSNTTTLRRPIAYPTRSRRGLLTVGVLLITGMLMLVIALAILSTRGKDAPASQTSRGSAPDSTVPTATFIPPATLTPSPTSEPGISNAEIDMTVQAVISATQYQLTLETGATLISLQSTQTQIAVEQIGTAQVIGLTQTAAAVPTYTPTLDPGICVGFLTPRLRAGGRGQVTDGDPNHIRLEPASLTELGEIPPGAVFNVLEGPVCLRNGANVWWKVEYNGLIGWTAEGTQQIYWLAPVP